MKGVGGGEWEKGREWELGWLCMMKKQFVFVLKNKNQNMLGGDKFTKVTIPNK